MKRRQVIKNIALVSSGMVLLPTCRFEQLPTYRNFSVETDDLELLSWLTENILPKGALEISTPETSVQFLLTMLDDCYDPKDIQKYMTGLKLFVQFIRDEYRTSFRNLNPEQAMLLFARVTKSDLLPESLPYFLATTKRLTVQHFTSSEYFLKNYMDFEFVPGRYLGCVRV